MYECNIKVFAVNNVIASIAVDSYASGLLKHAEDQIDYIHRV